jgi:hypothetical protein
MEHKTIKLALPLVLGGSLFLAPALSGRDAAEAQTVRRTITRTTTIYRNEPVTRRTIVRSSDFDGDGIVDFRDRDDDNDGILDYRDRYDRTRVTRHRYHRSRDFDRDGLVDIRDLDDDGDRILDVYDVDDRSVGFVRTKNDIDGDGIRNSRDRDIDGDGVSNRRDRFDYDPFRD